MIAYQGGHNKCSPSTDRHCTTRTKVG